MTLAITIIIVLNTLFALITVFREPRDIAATWAWILVLTLIPVFGFVLYSFAGRKLPARRLFAYQGQDASEMLRRIRQLVNEGPGPSVDEEVAKLPRSAQSLVTLFQRINQTPLATNNEVQVMTSGQDFFERLKRSLRQAQESINLEFYTFYSDELGHEIRDILIERATAGVQVHVLYDSLGSAGTTARFFAPLRAAGGHAVPFLKRRFNLINFQLNFRDHRKIVVVDGRVGFVGGFNIGDQYLGRKKKFGHWRDTHLKIKGSGVYYLQAHFLLDWNASALKKPMNVLDEQYFPSLPKERPGKTNLQIVTSGPDSDDEQIKMGYIRLIQLAKKRCWIQTPYLIPDDSTIDALRIAANSGVDVRIMVPCMPDHMFVYRATQYFASQLAKDGIKVYYYQNGFLHAKTMVVDDQLSSVGSANFDFRSFKLNFEVNAFLYDEGIAKELAAVYEKDILQSSEQTVESFEEQSRWLRFKQVASRLLAPIL
ncbi:cardiolipin synthase [Fructobacillus fructosus]|uniref:Cardiolipin synthase n=1 Tax=Fructobacillus fructosus TaxID=1631 RepID=A0ABM9MLL9_9LACO|nr:cardiolipin synthase [Fructobacillus fructosus]MBD9364409.1 cardiolipin synthase [Leuconostoc mesenteroides]MBC9118188.1 cardiolipin synthase [Fructobacillus fructosus]MCK8638176.1 cardiolipin synthase [Fructobacillus fructosus]CAK1224002.1 Phosphatidylserine/phosphatidylglycerophosphate/cardiolipin synthase (Cls) [Fructobacillus fructosus]CAK1225915.1 Phosphatidylserine/phosphatidylglycerophosphate/cardiolipin synthase (Cls) [Fructobacillus fructosus]